MGRGELGKEEGEGEDEDEGGEEEEGREREYCQHASVRACARG